MGEEEKSNKIIRHLDRIIMGAIIGGAIISVIGRQIAKKRKAAELKSGPKETIFLQKPSPKKKRGFLRKLLFGK